MADTGRYAWCVKCASSKYLQLRCSSLRTEPECWRQHQSTPGWLYSRGWAVKVSAVWVMGHGSYVYTKVPTPQSCKMDAIQHQGHKSPLQLTHCLCRHRIFCQPACMYNERHFVPSQTPSLKLTLCLYTARAGFRVYFLRHPLTCHSSSLTAICRLLPPRESFQPLLRRLSSVLETVCHGS